MWPFNKIFRSKAERANDDAVKKHIKDHNDKVSNDFAKEIGSPLWKPALEPGLEIIRDVSHSAPINKPYSNAYDLQYSEFHGWHISDADGVYVYARQDMHKFNRLVQLRSERRKLETGK